MPLETKPAITDHFNDVFAVGYSAGLNPNACGFAPQRASAVEGCQRTAVARSNDECLKEFDPVLRSDSLPRSAENWYVPSRVPVDKPGPYHYASNADTVLHTYLERQGRSFLEHVASLCEVISTVDKRFFANLCSLTFSSA